MRNLGVIRDLKKVEHPERRLLYRCFLSLFLQRLSLRPQRPSDAETESSFPQTTPAQQLAVDLLCRYAGQWEGWGTAWLSLCP